METFKLLSRGGARFDKKRFQNDIGLFDKSKTKETKPRTSEELPPELDFFKYTQNKATKRKDVELDRSDNINIQPKAKKQRSEKVEGTADEAEEPSETQRHRVATRGSNIPAYIHSFDELRERFHLSSLLLANLSNCGYKRPTAVQSYGIPILLESRDLAAISPTGTGKTLSYLLPIMALLGSPTAKDTSSGVRALVVAPTRELAHQIHNESLKLAQGRKWRVVLFSKATASTLVDRNARNKVDIIIGTPLRLVAALQAGNLELHKHLIIDEADRLLDSEFVSQLQEIISACTHKNLQKAVFSATLPTGVEKLAMRMLRDPIRVVVGLKDMPLPLISQSLTYVADDGSKLLSLLTHLSQPYNPPILIFTSTQSRASSLAEELVLNGIPNVDCLHAGMSKKEREDAISRMRNGESWILVSTDVMARGMDFKGVREVINYDFPTSVQSYIHRIGRTGRAGKEGSAVTFYTNQDAPFLKPIANVLLQSGSLVPDWILKLPKPSKMKRKQMGKVKRPDAVNAARDVGKRVALKKREMIRNSLRQARLKSSRKLEPTEGMLRLPSNDAGTGPGSQQ